MTPTESIRNDLIAAVGAVQGADAPGAAVALVVDGRPLLAAGVGYRDLERTHPLPADARCYLYSVTKILLAVAALRLVEQGRLALDRPLQETLPEVRLEANITLRQLLKHTGGLPDYGALPQYAEDLKADPGAPWSADEFLARTLPSGLLFPPGQGWSYSNIGYLLVRRAIERISRLPLRKGLARLIFRPLELRDTAVADSLADAGMLTPGYSDQLDRDGMVHDVARRYHPGWVSHGVVIATASEVARIVEALFAGRLLGPELLAEMLDSVAVPAEHQLFALPGYGLGLMVDRDPASGGVAGHGGGGPGYSTAAFHFPDVNGRRMTSVALVNRDGPDLGLQIAFALRSAAAQHFDRDDSS